MNETQVSKNNSKAPIQKEHKVQAWIEKRIVPVLKVISANKYLRSLMEGFYVTLPIIIFSSIDGIIMWVPPAFAGNLAFYPLIVRQVLNSLYVLTMGLVGLWFAMGIAHSLAEKLNATMPFGRKMNLLMVSFAAASSYLFLSIGWAWALSSDGTATENFGSVLISNLGSTGMLTSIIVGLTLPWIFYVPVRYNVTIHLPKAVPQGVSQSFADIIPYGISVMVYWAFGWIFIGTMEKSFTEVLFAILQPVFNGLDSYGFLAVIALLTSVIWFIGVHGPSVTRSFLTGFMYANLANNQALFAQGLHPHWALTYEFSYDFSSTLGGTGGTFAIPILFILLCKSKRLKAVGVASYVPIWFQVNEPALFGAPMILNPVFMIPFFIIPVINILIYKFFIAQLGMNGAIADVPWSMPAVVGLYIGSGGDYLTIILWFVMIAVQFFGYIPFVLIYDRMCCDEENQLAIERGQETPLHYSLFTVWYCGLTMKMNVSKTKREEARNKYIEFKTEIKDERAKNKKAKAEEKKFEQEEKVRIMAERKAEKQKRKVGAFGEQSEVEVIKKQEYNVLVICIGAGSSAMLANSARKGFLAHGVNNVKLDSASFGGHLDKLNVADVCVMSPQIKMYYDDIVKAAPKNCKVITTGGKEYVDATKDPELAISIIGQYLPIKIPDKKQ